MNARRSTRRTAGQSPARLGQYDGHGLGAAGGWASKPASEVTSAAACAAAAAAATIASPPTAAAAATTAAATTAALTTKADPETAPGPDERMPFTFSLTDPTVMFVIVCALVPPMKARDPMVLQEFATDPLLWAISIITLTVVRYARAGEQARLEPWEIRAASWYLWNGAVFHLLLDWGVGTLKFLPTMQENYQRMDTRYGCVPEHPCDGVMGVTREADAMVWMLTWIEAAVDAPLCFLAFVAYLRGWHIRRPLEIVIATSHVIGTLMFMGTELYKGLTHVPPPPNNVGGEGGWFVNLVTPWGNPEVFEAQFAYFWFAFICANAAWYYVPIKLGLTAAHHLVAAVEAATQKAK